MNMEVISVLYQWWCDCQSAVTCLSVCPGPQWCHSCVISPISPLLSSSACEWRPTPTPRSVWFVWGRDASSSLWKVTRSHATPHQPDDDKDRHVPHHRAPIHTWRRRSHLLIWATESVTFWQGNNESTIICILGISGCSKEFYQHITRYLVYHIIRALFILHISDTGSIILVLLLIKCLKIV